MMVTEIYLRPARPSDFFTNQLVLIPNRVYFEYSTIRNCFDGPFAIPETNVKIKYYRTEFYHKLFQNKQSIYLPNYNSDYCQQILQVKLKLAKPDDIKISKSTMKINYTFFLLEKNQFLGPYTLMDSMSPIDINNYLDDEKMYIIDSHSCQKEIQQIKSAS